MPHDRGFPEHEASFGAGDPFEEANTESFFESFVEPQLGHFVPFQSFERTRISLSASQLSQ
jgi:hypothetical protein